MPWRLFRHPNARLSLLRPWHAIVLFGFSLAVSLVCQQRFGAVAVWPANGVLVAALLLLQRRSAITVVAICYALNIAFDLLLRGSGLSHGLIYPTLNLVEAFAVAVLARRYCGAALYLRRPVRLTQFALIATAPVVLAVATLGLWWVSIEPELFGLYFASWVSVELLGILVITPVIVILTRRRITTEFGGRGGSNLALIALAGAVAALACLHPTPLPTATVLPILLLISLRLSPRQAAVTALLVCSIATVGLLLEPDTYDAFRFGVPLADHADLYGLTSRLPSFYLFIASILLTIYPASTVISERHRLQRRLRERARVAKDQASKLAVANRLAEQANEAKGRFLNMISHELRTPLGQVAGFTSLVATDPGLAGTSRDQVAKISMANSHALELVEDMIDFARGDLVFSIGAFDLRDMVSSVIDHVRTNVVRAPVSVRFENRLDPDDYFVGDAKRLRQLLRLLLHNAVKFTEAGELGIEAESRPDGARLIVFDTGTGIEPERLPELLQAFAQGDASVSRAKEGVGIGLALAHRILDAAGGSWRFESQPGKGTRVTLDIPLERTQRPQASAEVDRAPRLLVVDDHPANREILGLMLRALGCETEYASDGVEAVDAARAGAFDVILMDLRMPRMDGYEASRQIRAMDGPNRQVPILAVSAECREESLSACHAAGLDGFLSKPVSQAALIEVLPGWLDAESARSRRADLAA